MTNYIYLLQEREFIKTNEKIYKVGMTQKENFERFNQYPKGSVLLFQIICNDCKNMEVQVIKQFKEKFIQRKDIGSEYFEGNYKSMIDIIYSTVKSECIEEEMVTTPIKQWEEEKVTTQIKKYEEEMVTTPIKQCEEEMVTQIKQCEQQRVLEQQYSEIKRHLRDSSKQIIDLKLNKLKKLNRIKNVEKRKIFEETENAQCLEMLKLQNNLFVQLHFIHSQLL